MKFITIEFLLFLKIIYDIQRALGTEGEDIVRRQVPHLSVSL